MNSKDFKTGNVDLFALVKYALKRKLLISLFILPCISTGAGYFSDRTYAGVVVFSITTTDNSLAGKLPSALGSLSGIVGLGSRSGGALKNKRLQILKSRVFLLSFITKNNLERVIFKDNWDEEKGYWADPTAMAMAKYKLKKYLKPDAKKPVAGPPDGGSIVSQFLSEHFFIIEEPKTGILSLKIIWNHPEEAARIANKLVEDFNEYSRKNDIELFENQLRLYEEKYSTMSFDALRTQLVAMMASEMQKINIAEAKKDYALEVLDPAIPSYGIVSPNLKAIFIISLMLVTFIVIIISFFLMRRETIIKKNLEVSK